MQMLGKCIATHGPVAHTTNNYINTTYNLSAQGGASDTSASLNHVILYRKILQYGYLQVPTKWHKDVVTFNIARLNFHSKILSLQ